MDFPQVRITIKERKVHPRFMGEEADRFCESVQAFLRSKGVDWEAATFAQRQKVLRRLITGCHRCPQRRRNNRPIPPTLNTEPKALFITRNPTRQDLETGRPLYETTPVGNVFQQYLAQADLSYAQVYISSVVFCTTAQNSFPEVEALKVCALWKAVEFQSMVVPPLIYAVGNEPLRMFFGDTYPAISSIYGDIYRVNFLGNITYIIPIMHPSYILRDKEWRASTATILRFSAGLLKEG